MDQGRSTTRRLAAGLFLSFFTAQAAFVVLAPTLAQVARDFDVSVATAGQLRTGAAVAGLLAALALARLGSRIGVEPLLRTGLVLLGAGAALSAVAPVFVLLGAAHLVLGVGAAFVQAAGLAAAADWPRPERRADVLAWTMVGQPAAWVIALPVIGRLALTDWRWAWLVVPAAAVAALATVPRSPHAGASAAPPPCGRAWGNRRVRRWAFGEFMAYAGWGGTLVYAGAELSETYGLTPETVALLLAGAAAAYFPGAFVARRRLDRDLGPLLAGLALVLAIGASVFGATRISPAFSTALFAVLVLFAGARGIIGGAFGLHAAPADKVAIGSIRSGAMQMGYLAGAAGGGAALEVGGYTAVGTVLALFFTAAAAPHMASLWQARRLAARRATSREHEHLGLVRGRPEALADC